MALCLLNHAAELFPAKQRRHLPGKPSSRFLFLCAVTEKICKLLDFHYRFIVAGFYIGEPHIHDQDDLLPDVIKGNNLVKQHQVNIFESFCILHTAAHGRFAVSQIIVRKISYEPSRKGRKIVKTGTPIIGKDLTQIIRRLIRFYLQIARFHLAVNAGDLHLRIKSQERIPPPFIIRLR